MIVLCLGDAFPLKLAINTNVLHVSISRFKDADKKYRELCQAEVAYRLSFNAESSFHQMISPSGDSALIVLDWISLVSWEWNKIHN